MKYLFANWKMYLDFDESCILANQLVAESYDVSRVEVAVFPTMLAVTEVEKFFRDSAIGLGAQNCSWVPKGAYTGAVSALLLKEAGCRYVLLGHSERRHIFGETSDDVRRKLEAALDVGLVPVLCVGETKADRDEDKTQYRLKKQLMKALEGLDLNGRKLMVAYEPVWAIGSGTPCLPADVDDIHGWIRQEIKNYTENEVPILYGGSVDETNVVSYVSRDMVDGVLVGGASSAWKNLQPLLHAMEQASRAQ